MTLTEIRYPDIPVDLLPGGVPVVHTWDPNSRTGYPLFTMMEKGAPFDRKFWDLLKFEEGSAEFLAIDPNGVMPVVAHKGRIFSHSLYLCEYLDNAMPGPALVPHDPATRYRMRHRCRLSDEIAHSVSMNGWNRFMRTALAGKSQAEIEELIYRNPSKERRIAWSKALIDGFSEQDLDNARQNVRAYVDELDALLAKNTWLIGEQFTLADIVTFANFYASPESIPETVAEDRVPHFVAWLRRCYARPRLVKTFELARAVGQRAFDVAAKLGVEPGSETQGATR
ncbi:glutathione S-transferase family protein [Altererythrobacter fulvus]|uniref:glutathione S-transferase family protein n=1 Tax=Caenibius fulvus TaxID=2126012 RepID=UPI00301AACCE